MSLHPSAATPVASYTGPRWSRGERPAGQRAAHRFASALFACLAGAIALTAQTSDPITEGRAALSRGDIGTAVTRADAVLRRDPRAMNAVSLKVEALASARDWESALNAYEAYIDGGGSEDASLLKMVARGQLREAVVFFPSLRTRALGRLACAGDRESLLELRRSTDLPRDDDVDAMALMARLGDDEALMRLRQTAANGAPALRAMALQALQEQSDRGAETAVIAALQHQDTYLRMVGAQVARTLRLQRAQPYLEPLASDNNILVATEATSALAVLGSATALERLRPLVTSQIPEVRLAAIAAVVAQTPEPPLMDALAELSTMRNTSAWAPALTLLATLDPDRARRLVADAISEGNANLRIVALRVATRFPMDRPEELARLRVQLRDNNPFVRLEAATVLLGQTAFCGP